MATVVVVGAFDTKGGEFSFVQDKILSLHTVKKLLLIDIGVRSTNDTLPHADFNSTQVVAAAGNDYEKFKSLSKNDALKVMSSGLEHILLDLHAKGNLHGVLGMGGSCGTSVISGPFQKLPLGLPKIIVSAIVATGKAHTYIGCRDIMIMYSVSDFSGKINRVNRPIISNAAVGIAAMAADYAANQTQNLASTNITTAIQRTKPLIVASMIGITQACVTAAEEQLDKLGYEVVTFSCCGAGGEAMEKLIASGVVDGVLDVTTSELMHYVIPNIVTDPGPHRLESAGHLGVPQVVSLGGLDQFTFGPWSAVPAAYHTRAKFHNNPNLTILRTSEEECTRVGELIATKLNNSRGPVTLFIPHGGLTLLSKAGQVFENTAIDECLFKSLRDHIDSKVVRLVERDENINDPLFVQALVDTLHDQVKHKLPTADKDNN